MTALSQPTPDLLLRRLDEIGHALSRTEGALCLLGLGSCGLETERLDQWSDLDFFCIVAPGYKRRFLEDLSWIRPAEALAFVHRNTPDGFKLLDYEGVFYEFAVFEPDDLAPIPFARGRVVWADEGFDRSLCEPSAPGVPDPDWHTREAMSDIYTGLQRYLRGEVVAGWEQVSVGALRNALWARPDPQDPFNPLRRLDQNSDGRAEQALGALRAAGIAESACAVLSMLGERSGKWPVLRQRLEDLLDKIRAAE